MGTHSCRFYIIPLAGNGGNTGGWGQMGHLSCDYSQWTLTGSSMYTNQMRLLLNGVIFHQGSQRDLAIQKLLFLAMNTMYNIVLASIGLSERIIEPHKYDVHFLYDQLSLCNADTIIPPLRLRNAFH